jgi:hypothetical protein
VVVGTWMGMGVESYLPSWLMQNTSCIHKAWRWPLPSTWFFQTFHRFLHIIRGLFCCNFLLKSLLVEDMTCSTSRTQQVWGRGLSGYAQELDVKQPSKSWKGYGNFHSSGSNELLRQWAWACDVKWDTKSWKGYRNFLSFGDSEHEYCLMWSDPPKAEKVYGNFHSSGDIEAWNSETLPHPLLHIPTLSLFAVSGSYSMNRESCALPGFILHGVVILILISV